MSGGGGEGGGKRHAGQTRAGTAGGQEADGDREPGQDRSDPGQQDELVALAEGPDGEVLEPLRGGVDGRPAHRDEGGRLRADDPGRQLGHPEGGPAGQQPGERAQTTRGTGSGSRGGGRRDGLGSHAPGSEPPGWEIGLDPAPVG
jgi:hypothetical protein